MMLLLTPPGQQPTSMMPAVMKLFRWKKFARVHATSGMMVYCATAPMRMSIGRESRMRKSSMESVQPIVSMMRPRMTDARCPCCTQPKASGTKKASTATRIMKRLVYRANQRLRERSSDMMYKF